MGVKTSFSNLCSTLKTLLSKKVDKVSGKGLSTNDFTAAYKTKLDGIATGANKTVVDSGISTTSTNPVQNKAVGLKFQSVDSEFTDMVNVYGAKNLLSLKATVNRVNANGLNVSFLDDGGIRVYGTKTTSANGDLYFIPTAKTTLKPNTKYTLTVANSTSNAITARMHLNADGKTVYVIAEKNKTSISFTTPTGSSIYIEVYAVSVTDNNPIDVTVYPMLRYASIKDDTFVPYAMTNRELTEKVIDTGWKTTGNLKYRKSGCVVCLQGTVTPSSSTMPITLGTLPEDCRPSQDINIAQASTDTPSRQIIVTTKGVVTLLFASNCTASHTYAYNGTFMI